MKLADYMFMHSITPQQLRRMLGVRSRSTVLRYVSGERLPAPDIMNLIERWSGGVVTEADFRDESPPLCVRVVTDRHGRPRTVYPWTNVESQRRRRGVDEERHEAAPPTRPSILPSGAVSDQWPSRPLQRALDTLGSRAKLCKRGRFLLDGRIADARRIVDEANRVLKHQELPPIPYPGSEPLS